MGFMSPVLGGSLSEGPFGRVMTRRLQWGHAREGVEEDIDLVKILEAFELQWGHAPSGMEASRSSHRFEVDDP
jgi:hypothetical protein